jgi:protein-disulfide isomerase
MSKQARMKAREERLAQQRAAERRRRATRLVGGIGGVLIVGLLIAIVAVVVNSASSKTSPVAADPSAPVVQPANTTANGAIIVGQASAPVKLEIYLDYMCPFCGRFEKANGAEITRLVQAGKVRLELHPLAFLDKQSNGTRYSTRTANATATVADRAPASVLAFNNALYGQQPAEGSNGLSNDQIATLASQAGVPADVVAAFTTARFEPWVTSSTNAAFAAGITGTPTVKINGALYKGDLYTTGALTQAIEAAGGK